MDFLLLGLRKEKGLTQGELAEIIGVSPKTVWNWESGKSYPDAEQLWNCAEALDCTPNDLLGWYETHEHEPVLEDAFERELIGCYRDSTVQRKGNILQTARDAAGMSKEPSERVSSEPAERKAV